MNDMLARSPLACYSFSSSTGASVRVCYQDKSGNIKQTCYDHPDYWYPSPKGIIGRANLNNGIAITGWDDGNEERVYYVGEDDTIVERCWSSRKTRWNDGELTGRFTAAHYSNLAVMCFELAGIWRIRVYYQAKDNTIRECCKDGDGAWFAGYTFPAAIVGTSIAAMSILDGPYYFCIFYQKPDTTFIQYSTHSSWWEVDSFKSQLVYEPGAYITCASDGRVMRRVFSIDRDNKLCVTEWNDDARSWSQTKQLTMAISSSPAAATIISPYTPCIRVYIQINPGQISEWATNDGESYRGFQSPLPTN